MMKFRKILGKFRVEIGPVCKVFEARNLGGLSCGIRGGQGVFCLQLAHGLCVLEPLAQRVDEDRIEAVYAGAVLGKHLGCAGHIVWSFRKP